jgi:hypothetical protein
MNSGKAITVPIREATIEIGYAVITPAQWFDRVP